MCVCVHVYVHPRVCVREIDRERRETERRTYMTFQLKTNGRLREWSLIIVHSIQTHSHMQIYLSPMNYLCMWSVFLLSNVVCNGIPCYLGSSSASQARCESGDRRFLKIWSLWYVGSDSATGPHYSRSLHVKQLWKHPPPSSCSS